MARPDQLSLSFDFGPAETADSPVVAAPAPLQPPLQTPSKAADDAPRLVLTPSPAHAMPDARVATP